MGGVVASICSPCGGSVPPPPPKAPVACNVAGYDFAPESNHTPATSAPEPAPAPVPEPAPPPQPEEPPKPVPTEPITLETLQGDWVNSVGAKIKVNGTEVSLNGMVMKVHPVMLNDDGTVASIGRIWQMKGWQAEDQIEFKEAPSREVMEFARSVVWTRATEAKMAAWTEQMAGLGYTGSSKDVLSRGIEGCCPGTCDAKAKIVVDDKDRDRAELELLNKLIQEYRLPGLSVVPPRKVIPDFSNRGHTGLSVEHVHYLASSFKEKGFQKRRGNEGHDIPVLVKQETKSDLGQKSIENWRSKVKDEAGFPPMEHYEMVFKQDVIYTSLGNGHFNQALNLFACECPSIYKDIKYTCGGDDALKEAVYQGVSAIVLRSDIALRDRETISRLLNSKREFKWNVGADGSVDISDATEDTGTCKQFEALSKVLDAVELNCLVRSELGVKESHRIGQ
eukprot:CAMPEP_0115186482 /NCGR_PEP_ID=MMETSP0270-20121206/10004_1 /TAXON_ID=71861 /ORGANISM="Scrippsiella trochoidea, Strain CCMP3099" /LENGTH=449 /DNA_ID=CAMNT_0002599607 /DNA_START=74 /DNA_END=1423 /DNA_ORIENTATION=+